MCVTLGITHPWLFQRSHGQLSLSQQLELIKVWDEMGGDTAGFGRFGSVLVTRQPHRLGNREGLEPSGSGRNFGWVFWTGILGTIPGVVRVLEWELSILCL